MTPQQILDAIKTIDEVENRILEHLNINGWTMAATYPITWSFDGKYFTVNYHEEIPQLKEQIVIFYHELF